jgi:hypothetical protein
MTTAPSEDSVMFEEVSFDEVCGEPLRNSRVSYYYQQGRRHKRINGIDGMMCEITLPEFTGYKTLAINNKMPPETPHIILGMLLDNPDPESDRLDVSEQLDRWESCQVPEVVEELEAQVDAIRDEYLNHVEATKSPVIVLDAIGWILMWGYGGMLRARFDGSKDSNRTIYFYQVISNPDDRYENWVSENVFYWR